MADDCSHPPFKKARLEIGRTKSRRQNFQRVHKQIFNHKDLVKILFCNADESCSFSGAYCKTIRNFQEKNPEKRRIIWIPDLFDVALVKSFLDNSEDIEDQVLDKHLTAFEKLARFFSNIEGHEDVWHGSVDILLGPTCIAVSTTKPKDEDEFSESSNSAFELKRGKLESSQNQLISESITFAFAMRGGVVPLIGISKTYFSIYMYDPDDDLLYESSSMPLFIDSVDGRQLHLTSLIALWIVVNHSYFFKGVQSSHVDFGYKANLQKFLGTEQRDIYQNHIRMGGLRHVSSNVVEFKAGMNKGKFKRL